MTVLTFDVSAARRIKQGRAVHTRTEKIKTETLLGGVGSAYDLLPPPPDGRTTKLENYLFNRRLFVGLLCTRPVHKLILELVCKEEQPCSLII
jgi:hypothetical protein